jgi:hypothetical protein
MPEIPGYPGGVPSPITIQEPMIAEPEFEIEIDEELWTDDSGEDYTGWYCVRTDPWPCPAAECTFVATHLTAAHLVIVWPEIDDPSLLRHSAAARNIGRNPKVETYEVSMGPACSYYQWDAAGNPVHGVRKSDGDDVYSTGR